MEIEAKGRTGRVTFDGQFVTLIRKGGLARMTVGKGEKRIPVASIAAVQWKPAGGLVNGFIEFSIPGGNEARSKFGRQTLSAAENENAMVFTKSQMPDFEAIRNAVESAIGALHQSSASLGTPSATTVPDQIASLAKLRDDGVLSEDEFQSKKAQLLDRM